MVRKSPIQEGDLDSFVSASVDEAQCRIHYRETSGMVPIHGVDKVVLHVDDNQYRFPRVNNEAAVVVTSFIAGNGKTLLCSSREVKLFRVGEVKPLIVSFTASEGNRGCA